MSLSDVLTAHADAFRSKLELTSKLSLGEMTDLLRQMTPIVNPNLLTGTADFSGSNWYVYPASKPQGTFSTTETDPLGHRIFTKSGAWYGYCGVYNFADLGWYTFSLYVKFTHQQPKSQYRFYAQGDSGIGVYVHAQDDPNAISPSYPVPVDNGWHRLSVTFQVLQAGNCHLRLELMTDGQNAASYGSYKLEKGKTMTPWCPNASDAKVGGDS